MIIIIENIEVKEQNYQILFFYFPRGVFKPRPYRVRNLTLSQTSPCFYVSAVQVF